MADTTVSIEEAAAKLGVPPGALRLYVAHSQVSAPEEASLTAEHAAELQQDLSQRLGSLRLDDLARASLTIEWLAESALQNARAIQSSQDSVLELRQELEKKPSAPDLSEDLKSCSSRITELEATAAKLAQADGGKAMSMIASVQDMAENQGREVDRLRAELADLKNQISKIASSAASVQAEQEAFLSGLRSLLGAAPKAAAPARDAADSRASEPKPEASPAVPSESKQVESAAETREPEPQEPKASKGFENKVPEKQARYGVKREIEFNFLYERMGFKRPDEYPKDWAGEIDGPSDDQIKEFIGKFELACDPEEVDIKIVHRGEYQMVQYQRVESHGAFKNWIPSKKR